MDNHKIVSPSELIQSTLPDWIRSQEQVITDGQTVAFEGNTAVLRTRYRSENHRNFVNFMEKSAEAQERIGFSQDLLQNLLKYRDFDTYAKSIVRYNYLKLGQDEVLSADEEEVITLVDGYGFPETNGIISIDDEIILYRNREGNKLYNLLRGASGTTMLPTFRDTGEFKRTTPQEHLPGSKVINLSVLCLVSMLDTIHKTYATNIDASRVVPEVNRSSLLQNIKDFFRAKGTKLGIKSLFKFLFAEPDVDVFYPGDRMIKPSVSTWYEGVIVRVVPLPLPFLDIKDTYMPPDRCEGAPVHLKSFLDDKLYGEGIVEYVSEYTFEDEVQYEFSLNKDSYKGNILDNPTTELTRTLSGITTNTPFRDFTTITVGSTLGFPSSGVIFIDQEAITYQRKSSNQFLDCKRGHMGVTAPHTIGSRVYGPYYLETKFTIDGKEYTNRSWPKGLVNRIDVVDAGLLNVSSDVVELGYPGLLDPREQSLCTIKNEDIYDIFGFQNNVVGVADNTATRISGRESYVILDNINIEDKLDITYNENYEDLLVSQDALAIAEGDLVLHGDRTFGVDAIYFNYKNVYISSSGFPSFTFGGFNTENYEPGCQVGSLLEDENVIAILPRRDEIKDNDIHSYKGTDVIGMFIDGVRAYSNVAPRNIVQGTIGSFDIIDRGKDYKNPTILVDGKDNIATLEVDPEQGFISKVTFIGTDDFEYDPECRVTSGEGAEFRATFDKFGRIKSVYVIKGGQYYNDPATIQAVDATGKGKGALMNCEVKDGRITKVNIIAAGIDYDSKATDIISLPVGTNAVIEANTQYYEINRPGEILLSSCGYKFDQGNGFLYEKPEAILKTTYGYTVNPIKLTENESGIEHSQLIGFAFDGNPIYGPYGYVNNRDGANGVERQVSGYVQLDTRRTIKSAKSDLLGTKPPLVSEYPMGYFVQDFVYDPDTLYPPETRPGYMANEEETFLNTDLNNKFIEIETGEDYTPNYPNSLLDKNNGKICNTPEFPVQLFPKGVYCYFVTIDDQGEPAFPYIIGETFHSRPMPQELDEEFDIEKLERLRDPSALKDTQDIKLELSSLTEGSVSGVVIQDNQTPNRVVGDLLYIDNTGSGGGGAQALVKSIEGKDIMQARGIAVSYEILPHIQVIDVSGNVDSDGDAHYFTLNEDYVYDGGGYKIRVIRYMPRSSQLVVETISYDLPKDGDFMYDQKDRRIEFGTVHNIRTPANIKTLWFDNTDFLEVGDILTLDSEEKIRVLKIRNDKSVEVGRGHESEALFIEEGFEAVQSDKFFFRITTVQEHGLFGGDDVTVNHLLPQLSGNHTVIRLNDNMFMFPTNTLVPQITGLTYSSHSENAVGYVGTVEVTSPGYGYSYLPYVRGIYNRYIDRAIVKPVMSGGGISGYEIESGGGRYTDTAKAIIVDITNSGSGAEAKVTVDNGVVTKVEAVSVGAGYREPIVYIVQEEGKYLLSTDDIGKIDSMKVISPGRDVQPEGSGRPEVLTKTRVVVRYLNLDMQFEVGDQVFQGAGTLMTAIGDVAEYDPDRQIVTIENIVGRIDDKERLYSANGVAADVVTEGDSHCMIHVNGSARPEGRFIDDTSILSEEYAVIQDSFRYQWFSYVISSDIQTVEYDTFVDKIIHPSGFVRFGDLTLRAEVNSTFSSDDDDSGISVNDFDLCTPRVLIVGQRTDLPILTSQDDTILIYPNVCSPDILCLVLDGGVAQATGLELTDCGLGPEVAVNIIHDCGDANTIYCDGETLFTIDTSYFNDLTINNY